MGILDRMSQVLRANINDMLSRAEDPEKMLNQILRDMEDSIQQGTSQVAEQIAQAKMIQHDLDDAKQQSDDWGKKAELAVTKGRDDLAKEALHRQNDYNHQVEVYQSQLAAQQSAVEKLKADLDALKAKYDDARRNKDMLIARAKRTNAQNQMAQAASKISTTDYSSELSRMQRRIEEGEARVEADKEVAKTSVDDDFAKLGSDDQLDAQLADLKKKMGK